MLLPVMLFDFHRTRRALVLSASALIALVLPLGAQEQQQLEAAAEMQPAPAVVTQEADDVARSAERNIRSAVSNISQSNKTIYDVQDVAGDVLFDSNQKAIKGSVTAFNYLGHILKMPGDAVFDAIDGVNQPLTTAAVRPVLPIGPANPNEPVVVMAVSGGGSRMAYFHASVMEQLSKVPDPWGKRPSLLDRIDVISGVSGGCWSSAWYCANFEHRHDGDFFEKFKKEMDSNIGMRALSRMLLYPPSTARVLFSSRNRTDVMAKSLGRTFGKKKNWTFNDLQREWVAAPVNAKPPILIANGTILNNGQRLVMTNLSPQQLPAPVTKEVARLYSVGRTIKTLPMSIKPVHFEDFGSDIGTFRIADAVAASAAYPLYLPPYNLKVYRDNLDYSRPPVLDPEVLRSPWLQISDGGMYSNDGLDALYSLIRQLPQSRPVLVLFLYSQDLRVAYTDRDHSWWLVSVLSRMFTMHNSNSRKTRYLSVFDFHNINKTCIIPIGLHGMDPKEDDKLEAIPTAFSISYANRRRINKVTPEIIRLVAPLWENAPAYFRGSMSNDAYMSLYNRIDDHIYSITAAE